MILQQWRGITVHSNGWYWPISPWYKKNCWSRPQSATNHLQLNKCLTLDTNNSQGQKKAFSSKPRWWPIRPSISSVHVLFCCCQRLQFHLVLIKTQPWKGYEALFGISSAIWLMFSAPTHSWQSRGNRVTGLKCFITTEAYPQYSCSADHCRAGLHYHVYHLSDPKPPPHTCV